MSGGSKGTHMILWVDKHREHGGTLVGFFTRDEAEDLVALRNMEFPEELAWSVECPTPTAKREEGIAHFLPREVYKSKTKKEQRLEGRKTTRTIRRWVETLKEIEAAGNQAERSSCRFLISAVLSGELRMKTLLRRKGLKEDE